MGHGAVEPASFVEIDARFDVAATLQFSAVPSLTGDLVAWIKSVGAGMAFPSLVNERAIEALLRATEAHGSTSYFEQAFQPAL
jgi:hypothetical protein